MRRLYLIRHGLPDFPGGEHYCLGRTDMTLGALGALQASQLGYALKAEKLERVYSSPLSRAMQTAQRIRADYTVLPGLEEMYAGDWDGLSFSRIKRDWPELFQLRGGEDYVPIPNSEEPEAAQRRFSAAVETALLETRGDIAIVAHTTVNQSLISLAAGTPLESCLKSGRQDYCSYYILGYDGAFHVLHDAVRPVPKLDTVLAQYLLQGAILPQRVKAHCQTVAGEAQRICAELSAAGLSLDAELTVAAALLHDIARTEDEHPKKGAQWLTDLGYPAAAALVSCHHDLETPQLNEAAVLYIADKCVTEDGVVPVASRFEKSLSRCVDAEALAAHAQREKTALNIQMLINDYCGKEVIV